MSTTNVSQIVCSDGFYFDNVTNLCRPTCGEVLVVPIGVQVVERTAISISFVSSVVVFILALTVQRDVL
jgi:hypothetical protein